MMTVVERAFKIVDSAMLEASFSSWKTLMSNFALDAKILRNPRRINLLIRYLQPFWNLLLEAPSPGP